MAARTGQQIITDMIGLLRQTNLPAKINGGIYRAGTRPRDSKAEDCVVIYTTADAEQFQQGVVTLNIYVPDIPNSGNGVMLEDSGRCEEIEGVCAEALDALRVCVSNYRFSLKEAIHTQRDTEIGQSFVVMRLDFKYYD